MGIPTVDTGLMTVDEFYAFADTRPNHEKWELIGGEPFMNAAASPIHGMIVMNIGVALANREREINAAWAVIPDLGVRVSDSDRPQPDVAVITGAPTRARDTRDVIVAFEVLSPSTRDRDFGWKQKAYTSLPSLTHYVVVSQDEIHVTVFARDDGFKPRIFRSPDDVIEFRSLDARLQLADVYRRTGL